MNIYVSNLNFRTRGESLQTLFGEYGEVSSANIIKLAFVIEGRMV